MMFIYLLGGVEKQEVFITHIVHNILVPVKVFMSYWEHGFMNWGGGGGGECGPNL